MGYLRTKDLLAVVREIMAPYAWYPEEKVQF